jgi:hypothetical protein
MEEWCILERQLEAALGELKSRLLTVKATYRHSHHPENTYMFTEKVAGITRFTEDSVWRFPLETWKREVDPDLSPKPVVTRKGYVHKVLSQKLASMHSNPTRALLAVQAISAKNPRGEFCLDLNNLNDISRELTYRAKVETRFSLRATGSDVGRTPRARRIRTSTASTNTDSDSEYHRYGNHQGTPTPKPRRRQSPFDSSPDTRETDDEAQRIWREMKIRKKGGGSARRCALGDVGGPGVTGSGDGTGKGLVTLREVRETDFGPWAM